MALTDSFGPTDSVEGPSATITRGFLFADLRGYTDFIERHGDTAAVALLDAYRGIVREVVRTSGGAEIKTEGDSFYVVFPSASSAVQAGLAIVAAANADTAAHPERPIRVGVGIHAGESTATAEGYVGSSVNIAARVCAKAGPGEVLVTDTVRSLIRTSLPVALASRGKRHLKGIAEPIALYAVAPAAAGGVTTTARLGLAERRRAPLVAVGVLTLAVLVAVGVVLVRGGAGGSQPPTGNAPTGNAPTGAASATTASQSQPVVVPPISTPAPSATPVPAPVALEHIAYSTEYTVPDIDPCSDSFSLAEAHTWLSDPDGSNPVRLLPVSDVWERLPEWSPDGSRLAFVGTDQLDSTNLYVINADGSGLRALLAADPNTGQTTLTLLPQRVTWSPDGQTLAFPVASSTGEAVYAIGVDGGSPKVVRAPASQSSGSGPQLGSVAFMPDGRISVAYLGGDGTIRLYAVRPDGTSWAPLTGTLDLSAVANVAWAPDGRQVAIEGQVPAAFVPGLKVANTGPNPTPGAALGPPSIYVTNADGSGLQMLAIGSLPAWSPDSSRIAFIGGAGSSGQIFTMNRDGSQQTQITHIGVGVAACSVSWTSTTAAIAKPAPTPVPGSTSAPGEFHIGRLDPGRYLFDKFQPNMAMTFPPGWLGRYDYVDGWSVAPVVAAPGEELDNGRVRVALMGPCPEDRQLLIGPRPDDLVIWLQSRRDLNVSEPRGVSLGGYPGISVDVSAASAKGCASLQGSPLDGVHFLYLVGQDAVSAPGAGLSTANTVSIGPHDLIRFIAVDVKGVTVTLQVASTRQAMDAFVAACQPVLDSIAFPSP